MVSLFAYHLFRLLYPQITLQVYVIFQYYTPAT